jgi:hypothetical protein
MPQFDFPFPRRYNTLRLLGYDYNSVWQLCAISLVTDLRRPLFADMKLSKSVLAGLLSAKTLKHMRGLCDTPSVLSIHGIPLLILEVHLD